MIYEMDQYGTCTWKINIHPVTPSHGTLALVNIEVGDILCLRGIRIVEYNGEIKVIYPSYQDHNRNFRDFFYVRDAETDRNIRNFIISCYLDQKGKK